MSPPPDFKPHDHGCRAGSEVSCQIANNAPPSPWVWWDPRFEQIRRHEQVRGEALSLYLDGITRSLPAPDSLSGAKRELPFGRSHVHDPVTDLMRKSKAAQPDVLL